VNVHVTLAPGTGSGRFEEGGAGRRRGEVQTKDGQVAGHDYATKQNVEYRIISYNIHMISISYDIIKN
jgi:hypothetical protein